MKKTNTFQPKIGNEETAALPAIEYQGEIRVIEREEEISEACAYLASHPVIGFDTETRPSFRQGVTFRVSLLQLSTPERCYLCLLYTSPSPRDA